MGGLFSVIIFLGIIWFISSVFSRASGDRIIDVEKMEWAQKLKKKFKFIIAAIAVLVISIKSIIVIPPGFIGLVIFFGKINKTPLENGIHLINPLAAVVRLSVRTEEYTMSAATAEGHVKGDDAIDALTSEGLNVRLDLTAWYRLLPDEAPKLYETLGPDFETKIVRPALRTAIRDAVVKYTAAGIYTEKRSQVILDIENILKTLLEGRGILTEKILLRNVILPKKIIDAIDAKLAAEQEAQKMEFVVQKEQKEKERKTVEAEGIKQANQIIAAGLTDRYLQWYRIDMMKQLVNSPNNTVIFIPEDMKTTPIINIPDKGNK